MRPIFHLSIPVSDLEVACEFYRRTFGASIGRATKAWADVLVWGHQITLQERPEEVLPKAQQGKRHFGVVLPWAEWEALVAALDAAETDYVVAPTILKQATAEEHAKLFLEDPSHNVIEVKAYRNFDRVLGTSDENYASRNA